MRREWVFLGSGSTNVTALPGTGALTLTGYAPVVTDGTFTERWAPDTVAASTNLTGVGTIATIQDDPDSPDGSWFTATSPDAVTDLRVTFPTPTGVPAAAQNFRALLRKTTGTASPTIDLQLYQGGSLVSTLLNDTAITSTSGEVVQGSWNASALTGTVDGSDVECRIVSTIGTTPAVPGALPAYLAAGTVETNVTMAGTFDVNVPGHAVNDLLVLHVLTRNTNNDGLLATINTAGWTQLGGTGTAYGGAQNARVGIGWKIGDGSETVVNVTTTGGSGTDLRRSRVYAFDITNVGFASPPIINVSTATTGTGTSVTMPTVTTTSGGNQLAVALIASSVSATVAEATGETGGDWTEPVGESTGTNGLIAIQRSDQSASASISGGTATLSVSGNWVAVGFALNPDELTAAEYNTVEIGAIEWNATHSPGSPDVTALPTTGSLALSGKVPGVAASAIVTAATTQSLSLTGRVPTVTATTSVNAFVDVPSALAIAGNPAVVFPISGTVSLYTNQTPVTANAGQIAITVGMRWYSSVPGNVMGVRFYKAISTGGTSHTVALYSDAGTLLASKASSAETDLGWQGVLFDAPVEITQDTAYKVAAFWPTGYFPRTNDLFISQVDNAPLHTYANGGRFESVSGVLSHPAAATNHGYFVDLLFQEIIVVDATVAVGTPTALVLSGKLAAATTQPPALLAGAGSLALAGLTPTATATANAFPTKQALTISPQLATATATSDVIALPGTGALSISSSLATVAAGQTLAAAAPTALALTGRTPVAASSAVATTGTAQAIILAGQPPTVSVGTSAIVAASTTQGMAISPLAASVVSSPNALLPSTGALGLAGFAPVMLATATVTAGTQALLLSGKVPTVTSSAAVTPSTQALALAGITAAASASRAAAVTGAQALLISGQPASAVTQPPAIVAGTGALALTGRTPTVSGTALATVGTPQAIVITGLQATSLSPDQNIPIGAPAQLSITGRAPGVLAGAALAAGTPQAIALSSSLASALSGAAAATGTGALAISGKVPTVTAGSIAAVGAGALAITGQAPSLLATAEVAVAAPSALTLTGRQASGAVGWNVAVASPSSLALTGRLPTVASSANASATTSAIVISGKLASVATYTSEAGPTQAITITGYAPASLRVDAILEAGTGALILYTTGRAVTEPFGSALPAGDGLSMPMQYVNTPDETWSTPRFVKSH